MDRKRLITDSYAVVKRRESPTGHSKGKLAPELGLVAEDRGRGTVRAEEPWDNCEARGREPTLQGTVLGRPEEQLVVAEEETQPLSVNEVELELLRQFDLAWQYGPCTGITRLQRWHRAEQMGLEPPPEVRQPLASLPALRYHHLRSPARYPRTSGRK
ncbi:DNA polymerase delta subunit 4 isoform X1 [Artibeus jamaicensis]|uniref:DNA polymerase delta subunit 4 isoform X1 n=1 Tax=Artibeus jamaicensis TaxID=9417 RepID=UPI00235AF8EA|nr:DNA polymerase delta subunit 4 isoform X1 [Artibeus jamaicensis]